MNRKVLLVEPNYKNKYPPMGLMKLATYYRESGDDVRFFKGDLLDLAADIVVEDLLNALTTLDAETNWKTDKKILVECVRKGTISLLDEQAHFQNNSDAIELVKNARSSYRKKEYFKNPPFDKVGITTLFTFYWNITIDTINFVKQLCKKPEDVMVGGIMSTLLPNEVYEATGIHPFEGLLNHPGDIDKGDTRIIDTLPLDYSILEEIDYKYPANNAYFAYMTRGCINHCAFCAVPKLEPHYCDYIGLKEQIERARDRFGEQRDLLLLDNNVLASKCYDRIIDEIKACGFQKGATYMPPDQYEIAIQNLKDGYNDRAYVRKCIRLYKELTEKLPLEEKTELYLRLEQAACLHYETATKEECIEACKNACADEFIEKFPEKYNTYIEQGGTNVSGGQKQRLSIARAIARQPEILIFDDSTSAVDTATEKKIREALAARKDVTKIIIAQRVTSVMNTDQIIILDDGKVHRIGTHAELLADDPNYQEIYASQIKGGDENRSESL